MASHLESNNRHLWLNALDNSSGSNTTSAPNPMPTIAPNGMATTANKTPIVDRQTMTNAKMTAANKPNTPHVKPQQIVRNVVATNLDTAPAAQLIISLTIFRLRL
jgi:hypothetical protein